MVPQVVVLSNARALRPAYNACAPISLKVRGRVKEDSGEGRPWIGQSPFRRQVCIYGDVAGLGVNEVFVLVIFVLGFIVICDDP